MVNKTCLGFANVCNAPRSDNSFTVNSDGHNGFNVSVDIKNSIVPGPSIDANLHFSPDGEGGFQWKEVRWIPFSEPYYNRDDGTTQTIVQHQEGNAGIQGRPGHERAMIYSSVLDESVNHESTIVPVVVDEHGIGDRRGFANLRHLDRDDRWLSRRCCCDRRVVDWLGQLSLLYVAFFPIRPGGVIYLLGLCGHQKDSTWLLAERGDMPYSSHGLGWLPFPLRHGLVEPSIAGCLVVSAVVLALLVRPFMSNVAGRHNGSEGIKQ